MSEKKNTKVEYQDDEAYIMGEGHDEDEIDPGKNDGKPRKKGKKRKKRKKGRKK